MEKENKLDKLFNRKLKDRPVAFDESNWKDFQKNHLQNNKSQKPKGFWWFIFSCAMLIFIAGWFWISDSKIENVLTENSPHNENTLTNKTEPQNKTQTTSAVKSIESDKEPLDANQSANQKSTNNKDLIKGNVNEHANNINKKSLHTKPVNEFNVINENEYATKKHNEKLLTKSVSIKQTTHKNKSNSGKQSKSNNSADQKITANGKQVPKNNSGENIAEDNVQNTIGIGVSNQEMKAANNATSETHQIKNEDSPGQIDSNILSQTINKIQIVDSTKANNDSTKTVQPKETLASKNGFEFFVAPSVELNFISKSLSGSNLSNEYLDRRKSEEDKLSKVFYSLQVYGEMKNFGFYTGVTKSEYGEKTNYLPYSNSYNIDSVFSIKLDSVFVIDSNGTGHYVYTSDTLLSVDSSLVTSSNPDISSRNGATKISYFEIPIVFYYKFNTGKFTFDVGPGIAFGFLKSVKASYLNASLTGLEMMDDKKNYRKTIYNLLLNAGVRYNFNKTFSLKLDLKYRTNLNSVFNGNYPATQRYNSYGAGLGLMIKF